MRILCLVEPFNVPFELVGRSKQAGAAKIEQRPQIAQMVFDRSPGKHEPTRA